ncbi:hypothetical protein Ciccas_014523, partial [Cichlidogyrus casuarinus]
FDYQLDHDQLSYLKLLTSKASQQIDVNCQGKLKNSTESGIGFNLLSDDDIELDDAVDSKRRIEIRENNCGLVDSGSAILSATGHRSNRLPIRDLKIDSSSTMHLEIRLGEVCYS